jgi:hypothetical protein
MFASSPFATVVVSYLTFFKPKCGSILSHLPILLTVKMHFSTTLLVSFSLALAADVLADANPQVPKLGLTRRAEKISKRNIPSLDTRETCRGTCKTCFGATYTDCPNSDYYCWDPALGSADLQCSGSLVGTPSTSTSPPSPTITGTDTCSKKGASCLACFGIGSTDCPSGSYYDCYEPAKISEAQGCNKPGSESGAPAGGSIASSSSTPIASRSTSTSGIVNTSTSFSLAAGSQRETSTVPRITRTTSPTSSSVISSPAASTESGLGAAPALRGKDVGAVAVVAAGLVGVMGLL